MRNHSPAARGRLLETVSYGAFALAALSLPTILLPAAAGAEERPIEVPAISVEGEGQAPTNTLKRPVTVDRLPGTVQDTPQTNNTITPEIMQQQNTTTLDQVLRNVPGITVSVVEGGGLKPGQLVVVQGNERLRPGQDVVIQRVIEPPAVSPAADSAAGAGSDATTLPARPPAEPGAAVTRAAANNS